MNPIEPGQLRVWDDAITLDKTPFLILEQVDTGWAELDWQTLSNGQIETWSEGRLKRFSEVISETR